MMVKSSWRGHTIIEDRGIWVYEDIGKLVSKAPRRACGKCFLLQRAENDPCLGTLPGVLNACCGHGKREESYIQFESGLTVRGFVMHFDDDADAAEKFERLRKGGKL